MHFILLKDKRYLIGWNPKCGCTQILKFIFEDLYGFNISTKNVHDMWRYINPKFKESSKFSYKDRLSWIDSNGATEHYLLSIQNSCKVVAIIRDPMERFISGLYNRVILNERNFNKVKDHTINELINLMIDTKFKIINDLHHFDLQFKKEYTVFNYKYDKLFSIQKLDNFFREFGVEKISSSGKHHNNYNFENNNYIGDNKVSYFRSNNVLTNDINCLATKDTISKITDFYKNDYVIIEYYRQNGKLIE